MIITSGNTPNNFYSNGSQVERLYQKGELIWERPPASFYKITKLTSDLVYWDLGVPVNKNYKYEIDCKVVDVYEPLWGSRDSTSSTDSYNLFSNRFDVLNNKNITFDISSDKFSTYSIDKGLLTYNGNTVSDQTATWETLITSDLNCYLWYIHQSVPVTSFNPVPVGSELYNYRVYNELGELINNFSVQKDGSLKCSITNEVVALIAENPDSYKITGYDYIDYVATDGSDNMWVDVPVVMSHESVITCEFSLYTDIVDTSTTRVLMKGLNEFPTTFYVKKLASDSTSLLSIEVAFGTEIIKWSAVDTIPTHFKLQINKVKVTFQVDELTPFEVLFEEEVSMPTNVVNTVRVCNGQEGDSPFLGKIHSFKIDNPNVSESTELIPAVHRDLDKVGFLTQDKTFLVSEGSKDFLKAEPNFIMSVMNATEVYSGDETNLIKTSVDPELVYFSEERSDDQVVIFNL